MNSLESFSGESLENQESEYIYTDHSAEDGEKIVFRCRARSVEEADQQYRDANDGEDPNDNPYIGLTIEAEVNKDWMEKNQ